jgi:MFS family permease
MEADLLRLTPENRRRALWLGDVNAGIWAAGNGLTSGALLVFLAQDLGAKGIGVSLILAAPAVAGVLRVFSPAVIRLCGSEKRASLIAFAVSYLLILGQPAMAIPRYWPWGQSLAALVAIVCIHQLLEYIGQVCLLAWLRRLVPRPIRGRYFARRQIVQLLVLAPTLLASGWFADYWKASVADSDPAWRLGSYALTSALGALCLQASLVPLLLMPGRSDPSRRGQSIPLKVRAAANELQETAATERGLQAQSSWTALADSRFRRLLAFGCWVAVANGVSQSAQNIYPKAVLQFGVYDLAWMRLAMQIGQIAYSRWAGGFSDRRGNRLLLIVSQSIVAVGPLFYAFATPSNRWLVLGAWIVWSAFAGLNIGLPNYMFQLASAGASAAYVGAYFGLTNVFYAATTVAAGLAFDALGRPGATSYLSAIGLDRFAALFLLSAMLRALSVAWLIGLKEPSE